MSLREALRKFDDLDGDDVELVSDIIEEARKFINVRPFDDQAIRDIVLWTTNFWDPYYLPGPEARQDTDESRARLEQWVNEVVMRARTHLDELDTQRQVTYQIQEQRNGSPPVQAEDIG